MAPIPVSPLLFVNARTINNLVYLAGLTIYHSNLFCFNLITLYYIGGRSSSSNPIAKYLVFDDNNWIDVGSFQTKRQANGMSVVDGNDVCKDSGQGDNSVSTNVDFIYCIFRFNYTS